MFSVGDYTIRTTDTPGFKPFTVLQLETIKLALKSLNEDP